MQIDLKELEREVQLMTEEEIALAIQAVQKARLAPATAKATSPAAKARLAEQREVERLLGELTPEQVRELLAQGM